MESLPIKLRASCNTALMETNPEQVEFARKYINELRGLLPKDKSLFVAVSHYAFTKSKESGHLNTIADSIESRGYDKDHANKRGGQPKLDTHATHYLYYLTIEEIANRYQIARYATDDGICAAAILSSAIDTRDKKYKSIEAAYRSVKNYIELAEVTGVPEAQIKALEEAFELIEK